MATDKISPQMDRSSGHIPTSLGYWLWYLWCIGNTKKLLYKINFLWTIPELLLNSDNPSTSVLWKLDYPPLWISPLCSHVHQIPPSDWLISQHVIKFSALIGGWYVTWPVNYWLEPLTLHTSIVCEVQLVRSSTVECRVVTEWYVECSVSAASRIVIALDVRLVCYI